MIIGGGVAGVTNAGTQYYFTGQINGTDVAIAAGVGALTLGRGFLPTVAMNATGGALSSSLKGENVWEGAALGAAGSTAGYFVGGIFQTLLTSPSKEIVNRYIQVSTPFYGITKSVPPSIFPALGGSFGSSVTSEYSTQYGIPTFLKNRNEHKK